MTKVVVLSLPSGNFQDGFPTVTARLGEAGNFYMQSIGNLPAAPEIPQLLRNWRILYQAIYSRRRNTTLRADIEIVATGITHISEGEFSEISQRLETSINTWLNGSGFHRIELELRTQLNQAEPVIVIVESDNHEVWKLPWQRWKFFQDYSHAELSLSTPQYPPIVLQREKSAKSQIKILAILGNSAEIDLEKDRNLLKKLPNAKVAWLIEPKRQELNDKLWEEGWDILFFAGHSSSREDATKGKIYINQHPDNNSLTISELQEALSCAVQKGLKLAIFNSCDGLGLARDLAATEIPLPPMIVMREPVADFVAQEFLKYFLNAFSSGKAFHLAVRQAREQLKGIEDEFIGASWLPVICQHPAVVPPTWREIGDTQISDFLEKSGILAKFAALFLVGCVSSYLSFGFKLAPFVNEMGLKSNRDGKFLMAQQYYRLAALLDPNYGQPLYNLAFMCDESLDDTKCAIQGFKQAAIRGLPDAYAELARLEMKQNNTEAVMKYTWECLKHTQYDGVKAACLKNRGWVRFEQDRFDEAEADLREAIVLAKNSPHSYCLLAQVLENKGNKKEALTVWENTLRYSEYNVPEQDACIAQARQSLKGQ